LRWKCFNTVRVLVWLIAAPCKAKDLIDQAQGLLLKAKAKAKDSKFVLEDTSRTKAKDNNTAKRVHTDSWCMSYFRNATILKIMASYNSRHVTLSLTHQSTRRMHFPIGSPLDTNP